jgi:hypothetical protein
MQSVWGKWPSVDGLPKRNSEGEYEGDHKAQYEWEDDEKYGGKYGGKCDGKYEGKHEGEYEGSNEGQEGGAFRFQRSVYTWGRNDVSQCLNLSSLPKRALSGGLKEHE